jgi:hypothetical protein
MASTDVEFDQFCQQALEQAGDTSAAQRDAILADLRLRFEHPGEYIAYIDRYHIPNRIRRLSREVLAIGAELSKVKAAYAHLPRRQRARVQLEYLAPLSDDFQVLHDLPFR